MSDRKERRFIVKEQMRHKIGGGVCKKKNYDGVNELYRSFFAMHWKHWPNLKAVDILPKEKQPHTKRNLRVKKRMGAIV